MVNVEKVMQELTLEIQKLVQSSSMDSKKVIGRYTAAFLVNFTDWMAKTAHWARHEEARYALISNLRCEMLEDHVGMLQSFARACDAMPDRKDYEHVKSSVAALRIALANPETVGLKGTIVLAALERTSLVFIPDLAKRGRELGCADFTYTDKHGEADVLHSEQLTRAAMLEQAMGYANSETETLVAIRLVKELLFRIYA